MQNPIFWQNTLDSEWKCYVLLMTEFCGYLRMEHLETGERVMDIEVPVSKHFRDQDIIGWGDMCMRHAASLKRAE